MPAFLPPQFRVGLTQNCLPPTRALRDPVQARQQLSGLQKRVLPSEQAASPRPGAPGVYIHKFRPMRRGSGRQEACTGLRPRGGVMGTESSFLTQSFTGFCLEGSCPHVAGRATPGRRPGARQPALQQVRPRPAGLLTAGQTGAPRSHANCAEPQSPCCRRGRQPRPLTGLQELSDRRPDSLQGRPCPQARLYVCTTRVCWPGRYSC